jgi:dynein heavy chain 1
MTVMSASLSDLENTLFNDHNFEENVSRFAGDAACQVVYITKERISIIDDGGRSAGL